MTNEKETKVLEEGIIKKGGINPKPSTSRPAEPPKGQNPPQSEGEKK